jgi:hypothetical protein
MKVGVKELQNNLDLQVGTGHNIFPDWIATIEQTAKEVCNDPDCKRIKIKYTEDSGFEFEISDKEAADCIIKAIQEYDTSHSIIIRETSRVLIEKLENIKVDFK